MNFMEEQAVQKLINETLAKVMADHVEEYHTRKRVRRVFRVTGEQLANFDKARQAYPGTARGLNTELQNFCDHHPDWQDLLADDGLYECVQRLIERKAYSDGFWPMFQTFCNQSRFEEALKPAEVRRK